MTNGHAEARPQLRPEFVGMLFAITIAEIAVQTADLVAKGPHPLLALPAYLHLLLALVVVSTSWVGWSISKSPGAREDVRGVFNRTYLVLVGDVLLVVAYFILVKGVEIEKSPLGHVTVQASAVAEGMWIAFIFLGYFAWDIVVKAIFPSENAPGRLIQRAFGPTLWMRGWMSFVCLALAVFAWSQVESNFVAKQVIWFDIALIALVVFFRALKEEVRWTWPAGAAAIYSVGLVMATSS